ncbi:MAG: TlpA disulfide reductase family protein [Breznakibacter sp.]
MNKLLIGALALLTMGACSKSNIEVSGELKGLGNTKAILNKISGGMPVALDTVEAKDGKFLFELPKTDAQLLLVFFEGNQEPVVFFGGDDDIRISGDMANLSKVDVKGSANTALFKKFNDEIPGLERSKTIREEYVKAQMSGDNAAMEQLRTEFDNLMGEQRAYFEKFVENNTTNPVGAFMALNMASAYDAEKLKEMTSKFEASLKDHPYVKDLKDMISQMEQMEKAMADRAKAVENIQVGKPAPDFTLASIDGKSVSLSSLKGKYVLVDFWASWCQPCRQEMPNVVKLYDKYKSKGFEVLGVSTDHEEPKWKEAVAQDKLSWIQVRDSVGEVANVYGIEVIPTTFLLDKEGVIIARDLRGEELAKKLAEILK